MSNRTAVIEVMFADDDTIFMDYWDREEGKDICCVIEDGKIMEMIYEDEKSEDVTLKEIEFIEFLKRIKNNNT